MRGQIGQNLSYAKEYEPMAHGVIDAAKVARPPEIEPTRVISRVYIGCTPADYGAWTLRGAPGPNPLPTPRLLNGGGQIQRVDDATVRVDFRSGNQFTLEFPAGTDLSRVQYLRPGYTEPTTPETGVWTREFVDLMRRLNPGCIRGMDWLRTNGSEVTTWESRGKVDDPNWAVEGKGAPVEPLIDLSNLLGADLWFNVPHLATDDYVDNAAELIRDMLAPELAVYVERSNEVWNTLGDIGKATAHAKAQGDARPDLYDGPNSTVRGRQYHADATAAMGLRFANVFGRGEAYRVRPVLAGQAGYPEQLEWGIDWIRRNLGPPANWLHAIAVAPYFGNTDDYAKRDALTVEDFLAPGYTLDGQRFEGTYLNDRATAFINSDKGRRFFKLAADNQLAPLAYEGGLGAKALKKHAAVMEAVLRDPRVVPALAAHFNAWFAAGGGLYSHFVGVADWDHDSTYGAVENIGEWGPKAQALADLSAAHPHPNPESPERAEIRRLTAEVEQLRGDRARTRDLLLGMAEALK